MGENPFSFRFLLLDRSLSYLIRYDIDQKIPRVNNKQIERTLHLESGSDLG